MVLPPLQPPPTTTCSWSWFIFSVHGSSSSFSSSPVDARWTDEINEIDYLQWSDEFHLIVIVCLSPPSHIRSCHTSARLFPRVTLFMHLSFAFCHSFIHSSLGIGIGIGICHRHSPYIDTIDHRLPNVAGINQRAVPTPEPPVDYLSLSLV